MQVSSFLKLKSGKNVDKIKQKLKKKSTLNMTIKENKEDEIEMGMYVAALKKKNTENNKSKGNSRASVKSSKSKKFTKQNSSFLHKSSSNQNQHEIIKSKNSSGSVQFNSQKDTLREKNISLFGKYEKISSNKKVYKNEELKANSKMDTLKDKNFMLHQNEPLMGDLNFLDTMELNISQMFNKTEVNSKNILEEVLEENSD